MLSYEHKTALDQAIKWINDNYKATAIIASGSIIRGNADKNSDFDIYVIHEDPFRQRVQKLFNDVPCEIFINNIEQVYKYFEEELKKNRPVTANMISTGLIVKGNDNPDISKIVADAKNYSSIAPPLTGDQITFRKYAIANLFEDATDTLANDLPAAMYILDKTMLEVVEFIFVSKQQPLPRIKERLRFLHSLEPGIAPVIEKYYSETEANKKYELAKQVVQTICGETGFFEWSSTKD